MVKEKHIPSPRLVVRNNSHLLRNNPSVQGEYVLQSLDNKEVDWPISRQDKVRQNNQTEDFGKKKGRVRGDINQLPRKQDV